MGRRIAAFALDRAAVVIVVGIGAMGAELFTEIGIAAAGRFLLVLSFLVAIAYAYVRDAVDGASIGRRLFGLQVVALGTGKPIGPLASLKREVMLHFLPLLVVELVFVLQDKPRIGDRWARTQVIERAWRKPPGPP